MRISVRPGDRGFREWESLPGNVQPFVTVDGRLIKECIVADTKTGYVLATDMDESGNAQLNAKHTAVKLKQLRGRVEIEIRNRDERLFCHG